ncbi:MAG: biopolymer transporter ExbD [Verrucomicrobiales bacterium]|nr:biopolymer transporter ExbD [Verrucomicrobiales bacterium]MCP5560252.1 biopolymer transporter ExbD [Verrucomicrobiaceae bacterium]
MMNLRPHKRSVPMIPIVSLIDIMVILLIFFIATTTFKKNSDRNKAHLEIALPTSAVMGGAAPQRDVRVAISVDKKRDLFLDGTPIPIENLATALQTLKGANPSVKLELEADSDAPLGLLIKIWDALRAAGVSVNDVPARIQRAAPQPTAH